MWAVPPSDREGTVEWATYSDKGLWEDSVLAPRNSTATPLVATTQTVDPPTILDADVGLQVPPHIAERRLELDAQANLVANMRPTAGNVNAANHQCNTIQLMKRGGEYHVILDGVGVGLASTTSNFWIPRFREVRTLGEGDNTDPADREDRRVPAPVCITLAMDDGQVPPHSCTVRVQQTIVDDDVVLLNEATVRSEVMKPHVVGKDLLAPTVLLPYPARVERPPFVRIYDADARRR